MKKKNKKIIVKNARTNSAVIAIFFIVFLAGSKIQSIDHDLFSERQTKIGIIKLLDITFPQAVKYFQVGCDSSTKIHLAG